MGKKILAAYFSASSVIAQADGKPVEATGAELYEIFPMFFTAE